MEHSVVFELVFEEEDQKSHKQTWDDSLVKVIPKSKYDFSIKKKP